MSPARLSVLVVFAVVVAFQLPIFDRWFSHMDEGHVLLFADLVAQGGELYRDATLYPLPGAFYGLAQAFELFGPSIRVSRWIVLLEFALFVAGVFVWTRRTGGTRLAGVAVFGLLVYRIWAFPHWQVYSYSTTSLLLILGAVLCQLRWSDGNGDRWLVAAGLLFGLSVYCKQDYGAAALLVMTTLVVVDARARGVGAAKPALLFVGSGAVVGAAVGLYFLAHGILGDLLQQTVFNHVRGIGSFEYTTYPRLLPLFAQDPELRTQSGLFAFFPGIVTTIDLETLRQDPLFRETIVYDVALKLFYWGTYPFAAFALFRAWRTRAAVMDPATRTAWLAEAMLAGFTAAFVLLLTVNRPQDFLHVAVLVWPLFVLLPLWLRDGVRARRGLGLAACAVLALLAMPLLFYSARGYWLVRTQNSESVPGPRAGIRARPADARVLQASVDYLVENSVPGETVAVMPYFPIAHFLADRAGPDRSGYIVWPFPEFEDRDERIIRSIEEQGTRVGLYNFTQFATFPTMDVFAPKLFGHLVDHFHTEAVFSFDKSGYRLAALRRSERPETPSPLLDQGWDGATLQVVSDEAPPRAIDPRERDAWVAREAWPFRRALALRPVSGGARTLFRLPLRPAEGDRLETAVGLHPEMWFALPAFETHFEVAIVEAGEATVLFERTLAPHDELGDRGWFEVDLPLDAWAGRAVWLELSVAVDHPSGESLRVGGFAEPRIAPLVRPEGRVAD